ncbi:Hypothetical predicted protein [Olea europaea subsp. europaea]|uniref:Uncharacterized protein n=1 Tax=Olea europaea subsp. europaea TaxID=158383 RepID=A0A8S0RPK6_OLEEU|nr:Hypothetical predicted protein [Olea europaea subsp. europaea]
MVPDDVVAAVGASVARDQPHFTSLSPALCYWNEEIGACDEGFDLKFLRLAVFLRRFVVADGLRGRCAVNNSSTICYECCYSRLCLIFFMVLIVGGFDGWWCVRLCSGVADGMVRQ